MGYSTDFDGQFNLNRPLDDETFEFLKKLNRTRRMARNIEGYGVEGEFFVDGEDGEFGLGQEKTSDIIDYNRPPRTQPGLWCQWVPTEDKLHIMWDGGEKFYNYIEWIQYIIEKILVPRNYVLNGEVLWEGQNNGDMGKIVIVDNQIKIYRGYTEFRLEAEGD